jgi:hypothetical protein
MPAAPAAPDKPLLRLLLLAWLAASLLSIAIHWPAISRFEMYDADDYLRFVQVRDWVAGQSWFDVSQHRLNPPAGGDIHWSRIVDLPLGAGIMLLTPLIGREAAELAAVIAVPLLLLGVTMVALGLAVRPLVGRNWAVLTSLLVTLMPSLVHQMAPLRVDHQGWQIAMASLALLALLRLDGARSGFAAGLAAAFWVQVSAEALPYAAAIGALLGLRYLLAEAERARLVTYLGTLTGASFLLFALTRVPAQWFVLQCDAVSATFLLPFLIAAVVTAFGTRFAGKSFASRALVLGSGGAAAAAAFLAIGGNCLSGPFATLDPIVHRLWYQNVLNGMPVWAQDPMAAAAISTLWSPIVGGFGAWLGWRSATRPEDAARWAEIGLLLLPATLVAILIQRADSIAHLLALPGCGLLLSRLLPDLAELRSALLRVPLTTMAVLLPSPAPAILLAMQFHDDEEVWERSKATAAGDHQCSNMNGFAGLAKLPPQRLLAPLDIGPMLLASTPHAVMASGYHRNGEAMREVISAFLGSPELARAYIAERKIGMVAYCRGFSEIERYRDEAPTGFFARLDRGDVPDWLEPVPSGGAELRLWKVKTIR